MGCCRGKRRASLSPQPLECKNLEYAGSSFMLWPIAVENGVRVTVATEVNGYVDIGSFLSAFGCEGSAARMLQRYVSHINRLAAENPTALRPYSRTGISMADLLRLAAPPRSSRHGSKARRRIVRR
jgi:hypothetical protein